MSLEAIEPEAFPYYDYKRYSFSLGVRRGDLAFTSGQSASRFDPRLGKMVCEGDIEDQVRLIHEKLMLILEAASADAADVVRMDDYLPPSAVGREHLIDRVRATYFGDDLPACTRFYVDGLLRPGALVETDCVAVSRGRRRSVPPRGGQVYPLAVRKADMVFFSDPLSATLSSKAPPRGVAAQLQESYAGVGEVLQAMGATHDDVVKVTEHLQPAAATVARGLGGTRGSFFPSGQPAVTQVVDARPGTRLVSVDGVAVLGGKKVIDPWSGEPGAEGSSPATEAGGLLFVSGSLPLTRGWSGGLVGSDVTSQIAQSFRNVGAVLESAHASFGGVMKTVDHLVQGALGGYRGTAEVRRRLFRGGLPASTGVVVGGLTAPGALVQVECIASTG